MRGEILSFDARVGEGEIAGDDFARYRFNASDARAPSQLSAGVRVEFVVSDDGQARQVVILTSGPSTTPVALGKFDLGRVIQRTFSSIGQNWAIFLGGSALLIGVPSVVSAWGQVTMVATPGFASIGAFALGSILYLVGFYLLQGMVLKAAVNGFNGKSTAFSSAFDAGVHKALPLLGLAIVAGLGMMVGFIVLIVPGIFLAVMWVVAAPVLVAEKRDVMASLKRSADLTEGHRWAVLGLLAIYIFLSWIVAAAVGALFAATGGLLTSASPSMLAVVVNPLVNIASGIVASAGAASLYYELRTSKEGGGAEELASVFD